MRTLELDLSIDKGVIFLRIRIYLHKKGWVMYIIFKHANEIRKDGRTLFFQAYLFMYSMMSLTLTNHSLCQQKYKLGERKCPKIQFVLTNECVYVDQKVLNFVVYI